VGFYDEMNSFHSSNGIKSLYPTKDSPSLTFFFCYNLESYTILWSPS